VTAAPTSALVDTLVSLLEVPSVTFEEGPLCDAVEARLRRRFTRPRGVVRIGNALAAGGLEEDGRPSLALFGHLDTVPGQPSSPRIDGDRVIGLGASDMKSGLAVMLELADRIPDDAPHRLVLAFYDREETDFDRGGLPDLLAAVPALTGCDLALCLEPTDGDLHLGCVGSLHVRLTVRGRAAHSARPWLGESALLAARPLLDDLAALTPREVVCDELAFREVWTVTEAEARGPGRNSVPDLFSCNVNVRFAPGRTSDVAEAELLSVVAGRAEATIVDRSPSTMPCAENPLLARLAAAGGVRVLPKQAWTDVARLVAAGCAAANFGPGLAAQAHQSGEYCEVRPMEAVFARLESLLMNRPLP